MIIFWLGWFMIFWLGWFMMLVIRRDANSILLADTRVCNPNPVLHTSWNCCAMTSVQLV